MKNHIEINILLEKFGKESHLCLFCGTGWRASEIWFYATVVGLLLLLLLMMLLLFGVVWCYLVSYCGD